MTSSHTPRLPVQAPEGVKSPVAVATIEEIDLEGLQVINGYQLNVNDRVLVKNQNDLSKNGIYSAQQRAWVRTKDWKVSQQVANGVLILDNNTGQLWRGIFAGVLDIGVTDVSFTDIISSGRTITYVREKLPVGPVQNGAKWYKPSEATTYVYYEDSDSGQWVEESVVPPEVAIPTYSLDSFILNQIDFAEGTRLTFVDGSIWEKTALTGTPSQSPAQRGDGTLTDATGAVWETVRESGVTIFRDEAGLNAVENMISGKIDGNVVVTHVEGDFYAANELLWQYKGGASGIDNFENIFTPFKGYSQLNGGQISDFFKKLNSPLQQKLGVTFVGDSITWGTGSSGQSESGTRDKTLSDPRNNFTAKSWVNEFKRWVLDYLGDGATYTLSNHPSSPSGESIININKEVNIFPMGEDFSVQTSGAATDTIGTGLDGLLNARRDLALSGAGTASLFFRMTGEEFTLVYARYPEGSDYEVIINGESLGAFSTSGTASFSVERTHSFSYVNDVLVEIKAFVSDGVANEQLRIEAIKVNREISIKNQGIIGITTKIMLAFNYPASAGPFVTYLQPDTLNGYTQTASQSGSTSYSVLDNVSAYFGSQYSYFINIDGYWDISFDANSKDSLAIIFSATNSGADVEVYADEVFVTEFSTSISSGQVSSGFGKIQNITLPASTSIVRMRVKFVDYGEGVTVKSLRLEALAVYNTADVQYPTNNSFGDGLALDGTDDFVFYQLGTNDRGEGEVSSPEFMLDNMTKLIARQPEKTKPIIMIANPAEVEAGDFTMKDVLSSYVRYCKVNKIDLIDNYSIFEGLDTSFTTSDGLHPNDYGHGLIAKNIIYAIQNSN